MQFVEQGIRLRRVYCVGDSWLIVRKIVQEGDFVVVHSQYEGTKVIEQDVIDRYLGFVPKVGDKVELWQCVGRNGYYYTFGHSKDKYRDIGI